MELKQIKELMAAMGRTGTKKLSLKKEGFELQLEREENGTIKHFDIAGLEGEEILQKSETPLRKANMMLSRGSDLVPMTTPMALPTAPKEEASIVYITSPMVGTFYASPSPDDPSFVKIGDKVEKNSVVCIVEAMKVMNEVKAGVVGVIAEVLVESGDPVEFGTKLFRISSN